MFEHSDGPRLFGMPVGVDFPAALVAGIQNLLIGEPPEALARIDLWVNTERMKLRISQLFAESGATLLPRIRLVTELAGDQRYDIPPPANALARRLELAQLVRKLIETEQTLAAHDMAFDLADSLAKLLEEMQGEGVSIDNVSGIDVQDHSAHWKRSQQFIDLVRKFLNPEAELDLQGRQRAVVEALDADWRIAPPEHPIIVAGSTGSRGTTRAFMRAVARQPLGALVLPGVDFDMPAEVWQQLGQNTDRPAAEDHPQYGYHLLTSELNATHSDIKPWPCPDAHSDTRNKLVSLALRPAPVTDGWLTEGPDLGALGQATSALTLVESPNPRIEALAIALRMRQAAETKTTAALITPDQTLARQVTAALQAWQIEPNDSAGARLDLTPPGRLLRQTAKLIGQAVAPDSLLALLKNPLVAADERSDHLFHLRHLEQAVLRGAPPVVTRSQTQEWAEKSGATQWHAWLWECLEPLANMATQDLQSVLSIHKSQSERLAAGPEMTTDPNPLWLKDAGEKALILLQDLADASEVAGPYTSAEYNDLISTLLAKEEARDPFFTHPNIMIWGTLEARVQGAELVILAGLNDGTWPAMPDPDPWLNRDMRAQAGLRLPENRIGLSAHDFQQAIAAKEVWLTRSVRDAEAETVPSRWLNRLQNLMTGLSEEADGAFRQMQARGKEWVTLAQSYDTPRIKLDKAHRPAPQPPVEHRPKKLPVTSIETLIRDPYAVYAKRILNLKPAKPLHAEPDAALRGELIHKVLQTFIEAHKGPLPADAETLLLDTAREVFDQQITWPATRAFWMAKLARAVPWFIQTEQARRALATPCAFEQTGHRTSNDFTLQGRADRIDKAADGTLVIYDYKTGQLPSDKVQKHFNKQLPLLAALAYEGFPDATVQQVAYVGLGADPKEISQRFDAGEPDEVWAELEQLISEYSDPEQGYASRRAVFEERWDQDYDTLARYGEWDRTDAVKPERVGP